ncbi:MAG: tetratricopeptide repeat protein [Pseudomonadota bacterium]|nr:tetratricopeptide repeat protein [Pseudomonadota bacterium]
MSFLRLAVAAHWRALAVACALGAGLGLAGCAGGPKVSHEVRDPQYGDALYHFYQDRYFTAITTLMASQQFERVAHHPDEAEILRGGMLASYGMTREAGEIFTRLLDNSTSSPPVRDRAWFYLAKIRYQRGYLDQAEEALGHIGKALPRELREEHSLLQANLLMARADYAGAAKALEPFDGRSPAARYVRYNLGIAFLKSGQTKRGSDLLDRVGDASASNEEFRSLRDRANVALGFNALSTNQPKDARKYLERVRLTSLQSNKALLGFGWAADAMKDPKLALVPWLELTTREGGGDTAVLEAQIAVPYAYAELGAYGQAAERYEAAIASFERENNELRESIRAIRTGKLIDSLVEQNPGDEMGWFWRIRDLPDLPHARHLAQILAQHEFQEALKNYRDLRFLSKNLEDWRDKLVVFEDMLASKRAAFAKRLPDTQTKKDQIGLDAINKRHDGIAADVARGEVEADGAVFADDKQVDLMARVKEMRQLVDDPNAPAEVRDLRERTRLVSGVLAWQLASDFRGRAWVAKRDLQQIEGDLGVAGQRVAALAQAERDEPVRFDRFARRIAAINPALQVMMPRVAGLGRQQRAEAQDIAAAELASQQERIAGYLTQARFALAQLYDRSYGKTGADHAVAKP